MQQEQEQEQQEQEQEQQEQEQEQENKDEIVLTWNEHILEYDYKGRLCMCYATVYGNLVIVTEMDYAEGCDLIKTAEYAAAAACDKFNIRPKELIWVEHYVLDESIMQKMRQQEIVHNDEKHYLLYVRFRMTRDEKFIMDSIPVWESIDENQMVQIVMKYQDMPMVCAQ